MNNCKSDKGLLLLVQIIKIYRPNPKIKITMKQYFVPSRMALTKIGPMPPHQNRDNIKCWWRCKDMESTHITG